MAGPCLRQTFSKPTCIPHTAVQAAPFVGAHNNDHRRDNRLRLNGCSRWNGLKRSNGLRSERDWHIFVEERLHRRSTRKFDRQK
jgi:hypothetical protein